MFAVESHIELPSKPEREPAIRVIEVSGGYSEIVTYGCNRVDTKFRKFCFYILEVRMDAMDSNSIVSCKTSNTFFNGFFGATQIVIIEVKPDEYISSMKFFYNSYSMSSKSEGAINHDISLCSAQIETINIFMEKYRNMSETFFVQIVKK
ncbi:hypothetical protein GW830_02125 [bacterium]|nr:hypothetical protein [bacterium]